MARSTAVPEEMRRTSSFAGTAAGAGPALGRGRGFCSLTHRNQLRRPFLPISSSPEVLTIQPPAASARWTPTFTRSNGQRPCPPCSTSKESSPTRAIGRQQHVSSGPGPGLEAILSTRVPRTGRAIVEGGGRGPESFPQSGPRGREGGKEMENEERAAPRGSGPPTGKKPGSDFARTRWRLRSGGKLTTARPSRGRTRPRAVHEGASRRSCREEFRLPTLPPGKRARGVLAVRAVSEHSPRPDAVARAADKELRDALGRVHRTSAVSSTRGVRSGRPRCAKTAEVGELVAVGWCESKAP